MGSFPTGRDIRPLYRQHSFPDTGLYPPYSLITITHPSPIAAPALSRPHLLELLRDGGNLLHTVLVGGQVTLKGLMFLEQGLDLGEGGRLIVLMPQHDLFAWVQRDGTRLS